MLPFGYGQIYRRLAGLGTCLDVSGYRRKVKDHRYLVGSFTLSHIAAETSPSSGTPALSISSKVYRKGILKTTDCISPRTNLMLILYHVAAFTNSSPSTKITSKLPHSVLCPSPGQICSTERNSNNISGKGL